jgi:hypothetical protein
MLKLFLLLLFFCAVQLVTGALVLVVGSAMHLAPGETNLYLMPWASLLSSFLTLLYMLLTKSIPYKEARFWRLSGRTLALCAPMMLFAIAALTLFFELYPLPDNNEELFAALTQSVPGVLALVVVGPLVEELLFRGAIEGGLLRKGYSAKTAILVSAVLFGIIHFNPIQIPFAFLIGLLLGWCYYRTGSVLPGLCYHLVNNGLAVWSIRCAPDFTLTEWLGNRGAAWMVLLGCLVLFTASFLYARRRL